jgi:F0F1-type ATP synthase assembly protein I
MATELPPDKQTDRGTSPAPDKGSGWLNNLAQRSTGLPRPDAENPPPKSEEKNGWSYAGIGLQFAATTAIFTCMGLYVDYRFQCSPWGTLGLTLLGLVGGMYLLIKEALKANAEPPAPPSHRDAPKVPKDGTP